MNQREIIQNELEEIAPSLAQMNKNEPFETPQGYFEQFPERMHQNIVEQSQFAHDENPLTQSIRQYPDVLFKPAYAAALSVLLLILITGSYALYLNRSAASLIQHEGSIYKLSSREVSAYVSDHIDQFDVGVITKDGDWQTTERRQNANFTMKKLNNQELDQYIMANIDQQTIQNEMQ